jgi:tryptophanyl-tRNA synthetase
VVVGAITAFARQDEHAGGTSPGVFLGEDRQLDRQTVFSGLQPTGNVHLGNYLGALRNWVKLQESYDCVYCVVDLHAITVDYDPKLFAEDRIEAAKVLLACGIDPNRSLFYFQSQVPQHSELAWILGTMTPTGVLNRMTQYKDKVARGQAANLGLYSYPVLMAADILLYHASLVPIGDDQRQHLEMTRDLAERFNNRFGEVFPVPDALIPETTARVMSLTDPTGKMSKSDPNDKSRILILDSPDVVRKKIKSAVTDSDPEVRFDPTSKPGISNLLEIMATCTDRSIDDLVDEYGPGGYGRFKEAVAEAVVAELAPVRSAYQNLDDADVARVMRKGALDARTRAERFQQQVRAVTGLAAV